MVVQARTRLDPDPQSVSQARRFCSTTLTGWGADPELVSNCVLLVSELATNAVLHAGTPFTVTIERAERLRVEIADADPRHPQSRDYGLHAMSGRGLHLVEAIARASGSVTVDGGKAVWFELDWSAQMVP